MKPETVIGIDPGGNGTTGMVTCTGWEEDLTRWPVWLPATIEAEDFVASECAWDWDWPAWELHTGIFEGARFREDQERDIGSWGIAIEDVVLYQRAGDDVKTTAFQIGALEYVARQFLLTHMVVRVPAQTVRNKLLGTSPPKGKADKMIDDFLLAVYGGREQAVGGKRCKRCGGKGRRGRGVKLNDPRFVQISCSPNLEFNGRWYRACPDCLGAGHAPRGPLYDLWNPSKQHCRAALAVAVYIYNEVWKE